MIRIGDFSFNPDCLVLIHMSDLHICFQFRDGKSITAVPTDPEWTAMRKYFNSLQEYK